MSGCSKEILLIKMFNKNKSGMKVILLFLIIFSFNIVFAVDSFEGCTIEGYILNNAGEKVNEAKVEIFLNGEPYTKTISGNETFPGYYNVFSGGCDQGNTSIEIFAHDLDHYGKVSTTASNKGITWINVTLDKKREISGSEKEDSEEFIGTSFIYTEKNTDTKSGEEPENNKDVEETEDIEKKQEKKYKWREILLLLGVVVVSLLFVLKKRKHFKLKKSTNKKEV